MKNKSNIKSWNSLKLWQLTTWLLMVGYVIGIGSLSHAATTLNAVVIPNTGGYVGNTTVASSTMEGSLYDGTYIAGYGISVISTSSIACLGDANAMVKKGSAGVYGFELKKADGITSSGAVLIPDGITSWKRKLSTGVIVTGNVIYDKGRWTNTWSAPIGGVRTSKSNADGTSPYQSDRIFCPNVPETLWDADYIRSSSMNIRFFIDAPAGGLVAGKYVLPRPLFHGDFSNVGDGDMTDILVDSINITVAMYSCSLSTDKNTVDLSNESPKATINLRVQCQDDGPSSEPITAWLSAAPAGVSASITTGNPQTLGVKNSNGLMTIRGNWSSTAPANCNDSNSATTLYFDGRDGIKAGDIAVRGSLTKDQPASFLLCTTDTPTTGASYSAQATFSIVQR